MIGGWVLRGCTLSSFRAIGRMNGQLKVVKVAHGSRHSLASFCLNLPSAVVHVRYLDTKTIYLKVDTMSQTRQFNFVWMTSADFMHMYLFPEVHCISLHPTRNDAVVQAHELLEEPSCQGPQVYNLYSVCLGGEGT